MPAPPPSPALQHQFGTRVRDLRVAMGMSQEAFADRCGFARTYMSRIETGGANPSINAMGRGPTSLALHLALGTLDQRHWL